LGGLGLVAWAAYRTDDCLHRQSSGQLIGVTLASGSTKIILVGEVFVAASRLVYCDASLLTTTTGAHSLFSLQYSLIKIVWSPKSNVYLRFCLNWRDCQWHVLVCTLIE